MEQYKITIFTVKPTQVGDLLAGTYIRLQRLVNSYNMTAKPSFADVKYGKYENPIFSRDIYDYVGSEIINSRITGSTFQSLQKVGTTQVDIISQLPLPIRLSNRSWDVHFVK